MYAFYQKSQEPQVQAQEEVANEAANEDLAWNEAIMRFCSKYFHNLYPDFVVPAFVVSYLFFFGIGGYLHVSPTCMKNM